MNRRERRYGRMFLLPLLLGLTGIALLLLEWVLQLQASGSGMLDAAMRSGSFRDIFLHGGLLSAPIATVRANCVILVFPLILMLLYLLRIPPKAALAVAGVSLLVALFHVSIVLYCGKHMPTALCRRVPGYNLLSHAKILRLDKTADNVLLAAADGAFVLSSVSTVFTSLIYALVKSRSDRRNEAFDQRNAYLIGASTPAAAPARQAVAEPEPPEFYEPIEPDLPVETDLPAVSNEPTRVIELPPKQFRR